MSILVQLTDDVNENDELLDEYGERYWTAIQENNANVQTIE